MVLNQSVNVHVFALGYFLNVHGMNAKTVLVVRNSVQQACVQYMGLEHEVNLCTSSMSNETPLRVRVGTQATTTNTTKISSLLQ